MAGAQTGISGVAVALATLGGVLAYAGFRGVSPLQALRDVSGGTPPGIKSTNAGLDDSDGKSVSFHPADPSGLVSAAQSYKGDKYSQKLRHRAGYSDCASFVAKAMKKAGMKVPAIDTTIGFYTSPLFKDTPAFDVKAGDIVVAKTTHMAIMTGPETAIGQQNSTRNVQEGPVSQIMANSGKYKYRKYVGPKSGSSAGKTEFV